MKRKRTFESWEAAEIAFRDEAKVRGVLEIALRELAYGQVQWIQGELIPAKRKIGLCKLVAPHGGVVIVQEYGMVSAVYLDEWVARVERIPGPNTRRDYDIEYRSWLDLWNLARIAKQRRDDAVEAAFPKSEFGHRDPISPEVDQSVRQY
jgi:hypothetical protein